jgi:threonine/homoserine/homoserine lactone efflux protein
MASATTIVGGGLAILSLLWLWRAVAARGEIAIPHIDTLLTYAAVVLGLFLIPGPAVLLVLARASVGGRRVGVATGMGIATGDLVHTAMATVGLSAVLMTSALAFSLVKYAGAAYLIYLGIRALMERRADLQLSSTRRVDASIAYRQAVLAEMLNPKTALFFLAFLPQFVHAEHGPVVVQLLRPFARDALAGGDFHDGHAGGQFLDQPEIPLRELPLRRPRPPGLRLRLALACILRHARSF